MLSCVPNCKKMVMCLLKKIFVSIESHLSLAYSSVSHELNVSGSTLYSKQVSLNRSVLKIRLCIGGLMKI